MLRELTVIEYPFPGTSTMTGALIVPSWASVSHVIVVVFSELMMQGDPSIFTLFPELANPVPLIVNTDPPAVPPSKIQIYCHIVLN